MATPTAWIDLVAAPPVDLSIVPVGRVAIVGSHTKPESRGEVRSALLTLS